MSKPFGKKLTIPVIIALFALLFIPVEMSNVYADTIPYEILWSEQFGTSDIDYINTVTIDNTGNIIVAGNTGGSLDGNNTGSYDAFIRIYDTDVSPPVITLIGEAWNSIVDALRESIENFLTLK